MKYKYVTILSKMPEVCPICKSALLNEFKEYPRGNTYALEKNCYKLDHHFYCSSTRGDEDKLSFISLSLDTYKQVYINWIVLDKKMYVRGHKRKDNTTNNLATTYLPYVEPDFSDPPKILNKLRLYLKFL